jgi:hypothetical protein
MIITLIFPIIVIAGVSIFLFNAPKNNKIIKPLRNSRLLFAFLILWTLIGFFTQQDFTERCGCLIHSRGIFSLDYIIFSFISLILLVSGFIAKNKIIKISLISVELAYWIFKLFALKSGYEGGLGILMFKYYDFLGLLGRFLLLKCLFGNKYKEYIFALISGLLIIIKMLGVPCNENFIYRDFLNPYYNQLLFNDINGNWTSSVLFPKVSVIDSIFKNPDKLIYGSKPEITTYRDTVTFTRFDDSYFYFSDSSFSIENAAPELNGKYFLTYSQPESGYLVYLPIQHIAAVKEDYRYNQHSLTLYIIDVNETTITCKLNGEIDLLLKTAGNKM